MRPPAAALLVVLAAPAVAETTAITGVRFVDGKRGEPVENATIVIRGGRIVSAGSDVEIPADARRIARSGRTVIPGLITAHSHIGQFGGVERGAKNYTREIIAAELEQFGRYGATTVVVLGNKGPLFQSFARKLIAENVPTPS